MDVLVTDTRLSYKRHPHTGTDPDPTIPHPSPSVDLSHPGPVSGPYHTIPRNTTSCNRSLLPRPRVRSVPDFLPDSRSGPVPLRSHCRVQDLSSRLPGPIDPRPPSSPMGPWDLPRGAVRPQSLPDTLSTCPVLPSLPQGPPGSYSVPYSFCPPGFTELRGASSGRRESSKTTDTTSAPTGETG